MFPSVVLSLSGGLDSTTLLAKAKHEAQAILAVIFKYGSKHNTHEILAAKKIAGYYGVKSYVVDLTSAFAAAKVRSSSALMKDDLQLPEGHYQNESMRQTVVPGRNLIFASVLASIAEAENYSEVWLGIHKGDWEIYPDCRPDWLTHTRLAVTFGSNISPLSVLAPFHQITKKEILELGYRWQVPYHLTRTCYTSNQIACGRCGSCQERLEAFSLMGVDDPLEYQSRQLLGKETA